MIARSDMSAGEPWFNTAKGARPSPGGRKTVAAIRARPGPGMRHSCSRILPLSAPGNAGLAAQSMKNAAELANAAGNDKSLVGYLRAHLNRLRAGDYFALLAYVEMNEGHEEQLQTIRHAVRNQKRTATCLGFGPRFLHSTGQAYKGGPNTGVFLQLTCDDAQDLPVPGQKYTFGVVKAAQARGDFQVLAERNRRALRVHLGADLQAGLSTLQAAVKQATN